MIRRTAQLGVTGFSQAGKTVFVTSLINHLLCHDPRNFKLDANKPRQIEKARAVRAKKKSVWEEFPYQRFRDQMAQEAVWPEKTKDCYRYTITFRSRSRLPLPYKLTLYDLPGERLADAPMLDADYEAWSKTMLDFLLSTRSLSGPYDWHETGKLAKRWIHDYCQLANSPPAESVDEEDVLTEYKKALIGVAYHGRYVSPSTFSLDRRGTTLEETWRQLETSLRNSVERLEEAARSRHSGLDGEEFAPLGEDWRGTKIVRKFRKRYEKYKKEVVQPWFRSLLSCSGVILLIDIADIIAGGPAALNELTRLGNQLFRALTEKKWTSRLLGKARWSKPRLVVAASQCDRFHPEDWQSLQRLAADALRRHAAAAGLEALFYFCSAVRSTVEVHGASNKLRGRLVSDGAQNNRHQDGTQNKQQEDRVDTKETEYEVPRIPQEWDDQWPDDWDPTVIKAWPRALPRFPAVWDRTPDHVNLDKVFRLATGWFQRVVPER